MLRVDELICKRVESNFKFHFFKCYYHFINCFKNLMVEKDKHIVFLFNFKFR